MGWLGLTSEKPNPVNRQDRQKCWESRDAYFACLDRVSVSEAGKEGKACAVQNARYEENCARSWIDYFNKRRVMQEQQKSLLDPAKTQAEEARRKSL